MRHSQDNAFEYPIDGVLDLHAFNPKDARDIILEYIDACHEKGIFDLRIIHGKGQGVLRMITHSILKKHPLVKSFRLDPDPWGSWGATIVELSRDQIAP
jgi:DNA-nicking Smr family endonuclease